MIAKLPSVMLSSAPIRAPFVGAVLVSALAIGCGAKSPVGPSQSATRTETPIMAESRLSAAQLAAWASGRQPQPAGAYAATVPLETLARYFLEEGSAEGVTGDVAFVQGIVETAWFRFSGVVPASANNFGGIGAIDSHPGAYAVFADARTGVRAQIQHLRAYADPSAYACAVPPLHHPCVDPRFDLVVPKGRARTWNQLGNGNWATAASYGAAILQLYDEALAQAAKASATRPSF